MYRLLFSLALVLSAVGILRGADPLAAQPAPPPYNPVFDDAGLPSIHIEIEQADLDFLYASGNEESDAEFPATFTFDDGTIQETVAEVGFRLRGNTSRVSRKKSFKVSFNTFSPGRTFFGLEKLNLNGEHNDPTIARAKLSWDLFQEMGIPAARANHVALTINGEYYGLYLNVEHVDERFLGARYTRTDGNLYKCLWPADLTYRSDDAEAYRPQDDSRRPYDLKLKDSDDEGYDDLAHFIDVLNNTEDAVFPDAIESVFNVNGYLKALAVDVATGSWDDSWFLKNNFYLYYDPAAERFDFIPFDYDNTFGIWWDGILPGTDWGTRNVYSWGHPTEPRPLANRILAVPDFRARFTFYLRRLLEGPFLPATLQPRIEALHTHLTPAAEADVFRTLDYGFSVQDFHDAFSRALGEHVTYGLSGYVDARWASALAQLEATDVVPILTALRHEPLQPRAGEAITVHVRVEDEAPLDAVVVLHYQVDGGPEQIVALDDGQHSDGAAGDGHFAAVLPPQPAAARVLYRVFATDAAGQTRFTLPGVADVSDAAPALYINEFMAGNDTAVSDEQREFDDWVELYNAGNRPLSMDGLFLTDDLGTPGRWPLPDTLLAPGAFLLIWADGQPEQGPLHAPFKLNVDGEQLGLFDAAQRPIDTLTYAVQQPDVSFGRATDGAAPFTFLPAATPGAPNNATGTAIGTPTLPAAFRVGAAFPNPFRAHTTVAFTLDQPGRVRLTVFDALGRQVRQPDAAAYPAGRHHLTWDGYDEAGRGMPSGLYLLRLQALDPNRQVRRVITMPAVRIR